MISVNALGAHIIFYQWATLVYMVPLGVSQAASTLTGNYIGKGMPALAKQYSRFSMFFAIFLIFAISVFLGVFKHQVASFLT